MDKYCGGSNGNKASRLPAWRKRLLFCLLFCAFFREFRFIALTRFDKEEMLTETVL